MSENDAWQYLDWAFPNVTAEAVGKALEGFSQPLVMGRDTTWLAMAVSRSLAIYGRDRIGPGNAAIRDELGSLSAMAWTTWRAIEARSGAANSAVFDYAYRMTPRDQRLSPNAPPQPEGYRNFREAVTQLHWLAAYLGDAAKDANSGERRQSGPWKASVTREQRIERGYALAGVFEVAFDARPTVNKLVNACDAPTAFMDFYQRMLALAIGENATADISNVLQEALRRHRQDPAAYAPGCIPGLPVFK